MACSCLPPSNAVQVEENSNVSEQQKRPGDLTLQALNIDLTLWIRRLEREFKSKLNISRIASGSDTTERSRSEGSPDRVEIRVVKYVEHLGTELHIHRFPDLDVLED